MSVLFYLVLTKNINDITKNLCEMMENSFVT